MNQRFKRMLCLTLSAFLLLSPVSDAIATHAAAATVYQLSELLSQGKIKALGRTQSGGNGILADWSGAGFEINISGSGGTMAVGYKASYASYWVILFDGVQAQRIYAASASGGSSFSFTVPSGSHTISVVKDTEISTSQAAYYDLTTLTFAGQIEAAPANKDLYIEFIGDSYSCGDGAAGAYDPGAQAWIAVNHAATRGFPWYTAKALNADYSIVARGGIGLFVGISEQEGTANKKGMQDIYKYTSGYRASAGEYDFARQPDVIIVELGANDGISASDAYKTIEYWTSLLVDFTDQIRQKNPNASIVFLSHNAVKHRAMMSIVEDRKASDPGLYAFYFAHNGNGSAALATQYDGHPDADDQKQLSEALVNYLKYTDIIPTQVVAPTYNDLEYYVSQSGNDSNSGQSIANPKATLQAAVDQASSDNSGSFGANDRLVIYVDGTVSLGSEQQAIAQSAMTPVLITTYNYSGTKAILDTSHAPANDASAYVSFGSNVTLKDITLQSTTGAAGYRDRYLYAGNNDVVLDNVTFAMAGTTPTNNSGWIVSAGHAAEENAPAAETASSITFQNGDYTNLAHVTAVQPDSVSNLTQVNCKIIIEDGAAMGTVYNRVGNAPVKSAAVDVRGGSVAQYVGTTSGTSSARRTYEGDIVLTMSGGTIYGTSFATTGKYATINGDINTTISGGKVYITPETSDQYDAYLFGGGQNAIVNDISTTISGGTFYLVTNIASVDSGFYFGPSGGGKAKNVTNTISNASFLPMAGTAATSHVTIYMGPHMGSITGTLRNEIISGTFSFDAASAAGSVVFGSRGVNWPIGKIVNILGKEGSLQGPRFLRATTNLGGTWAQVGTSSKLTAEPAATDSTDAVVISNTIYGGYFASTVYAGPTSVTDTTKSRYSFVLGSIENKVYSGHFLGSFIGGGKVNVYGHIANSIYGGIFTNVYGGNLSGSIYDGVSMNIYGMQDYTTVYPANTWKIYAGGSGCNIYTQTAGRDSVVLTLGSTTTAGSAAEPLKLTMPVLAHNKGSAAMGASGTTRLVLKNTILDEVPTGFDKTDITLDGNDTLTILTGETLVANTVSGSGSIVFGSGTSLTVADAASGQIACSVDGEIADNFSYITAPAETADSTFTFPEGSGVQASTSNGKQWTTGEVIYEHVSIAGPNGTKGYDTLAEAVDAYTGDENTYIVLWEDIQDPVSVNKPIYLDLNGHNASINLTGEGAVYGLDSTSDTIKSPAGSLSVVGDSVHAAASTSIAGEPHHYLALAKDGMYTFHRVIIDTKKGLRTYSADNRTGIYFQPVFKADADVIATIDSNPDAYDFGVRLYKMEDGVANHTHTISLLDYNGTFQKMIDGAVFRVAVYDLMPKNAEISARQNKKPYNKETGEGYKDADVQAWSVAEYLSHFDISECVVRGESYITVNEQTIYDMTPAELSLQSAIKQVDAKYDTLTPAQLSAVDKMWSDYSRAISSWFNATDGSVDEGLINIGNIKIDISDWFN